MELPLLEKQARLAKLKKIRSQGVDPYPPSNKRTHSCRQVLLDFEALAKKHKTIALAGRLRSKRWHGGVSFAHLEDESAGIQLFLRKDTLGERAYNFFKDLIDVGDFVRVKGTLFQTKRGEKSLEVHSLKILTKTLRPLPEKWHGLSNVETRYRHRSLDMIANPQVRGIFKKRSLINQKIREFLLKKGYLEVETPILQPIYGGGLAKPFKTHHNALDIPLYLRISDELYLKRLVVGGFEKIFEFCRDFRNEGISPQHNPEFTILEAMTAYEDYRYSMDLVESIYEYVAKEVEKKMVLEYQGVKINLKRPWKRYQMTEIVKNETGFDYEKFSNSAEAKKEALKLGLNKKALKPLGSVGEILELIFEEKVEQTLIQPTIIYNYPVETSPLAKKCPDNPRFVQRFEHFIYGKEQGNHYSELNDPVDLKERFILEKKKMQAGFAEAHQTDEDFLKAIEHGLPPVTGIGIGIDRLVMFFTNSPSIKEVITFPILRPKK